MTTSERVSESEKLARRVREALGEFDNKDLPLTSLVQDLAAKCRQSLPLLEGGKGERVNADSLAAHIYDDLILLSPKTYVGVEKLALDIRTSIRNLIPLYTAPQPAAQQTAPPCRDWLEDGVHENGCYECTCAHCGHGFVGLKRRTCCKVCAQPAGDGGVDAPFVCDGKEQGAFEKWASDEKFDMEVHPLHWLFLNDKTYSARRGWKAAIEYCAAIAALRANAGGVK